MNRGGVDCHSRITERFDLPVNKGMGYGRVLAAEIGNRSSGHVPGVESPVLRVLRLFLSGLLDNEPK